MSQPASKAARARSAIGEGRLFDADITPHLVDAAEAMARLKEQGTSVNDALAQAGLNVAIFGRASDHGALDYPDRVTDWHLADIHQVLAAVRQRAPGPLWLMSKPSIVMPRISAASLYVVSTVPLFRSLARNKNALRASMITMEVMGTPKGLRD